VLRILDTNDLYAVGRETTGRGGDGLWVRLSLEDELVGYHRADLVWSIQNRDERKIRQAAPDLEVRTVGHPVELKPPDIESGLRSREILLVATKHKWNLQGLRWFAAEVYPLLSDFLPAKNVVIVGDIADVVQHEMPFKFLGRVADLTPVYRGARVVISPILGGAGLKIKNIEPMGHGKAVVSTRSAAMGLEAAENKAFLVGDDAAGFADAIRRVMEDDGLCRRLMEGAFLFAQEWNEEVLAALRESFQMKRKVAR
jgi:succinoglycan biosynthesis protein ExoO